MGKCHRSATHPESVELVAADDKPSSLTERARDHWATVAAGVHDAIGAKIDQRKRDHLADTLERFERELVPTLAPMLAGIVDNENVPHEVRDLVAAVIEPEHFTQSLLIGIAVGAVISPVLGAATAPYVQSLANEVWPHNPVVPLSPAELALATLRHNPHVGAPYGEAAMSGVNKDRMDALIYNTGEALALGELLLLYRRGQIDEARLVTGMRQSRIRDEWMPELLDLRFAPPGAGEVIAGALKRHLPIPDARQKLGEAGINPVNFDWMLASAGRPPGVETVVQLWNRGYATEADVDRTIAQSDVNPDFATLVKATRWYHVPPRSIVPMLRAGGITEARARVLLTEHGVRAEDQDAFITEAHTSRTVATREIGAQQALRAYEQRLIDRSAVVARLVALRYVQPDIDLLIELADHAVTERFRNAAITRVRSRYVAHKLDNAAAQALLAKLQLPGPAITDLLTLWADERAANVATLTVGQWQQGYHRGIIGLSSFVAQMQAHGYHGVEIKILAAEAWPMGKIPAEVTALNPTNL